MRARSIRALLSSQPPSKAVTSGCGTLHGNGILGSHHPHSTVSLLFQTSHIGPQKSQPTPLSQRQKPNRPGRMPTHKLKFFFFCLCSSITVSCEIQLILVNNCNHSVWPATLGNAGHPTPKDGGFHLDAFEETFFDVPPGWSGRIWARKGCCFDKQGKGSCDTGDCSGRLHCQGMSGAPPATIVEMTFGTTRSPLHYYDVSLVDGFNLPVTIKPIGGGMGCGVAGCEVDLNVCCPSKFEERRQGKVVGCKSACLALKTDKYCCTGDYSSPKSCKPTLFSHIFKSLCPHAYSFAYDDPTSLRTCRASRYLITFCPPAR